MNRYHYFPDTNVLLAYFNEFEKDKFEDADFLFGLTKRNGNLQGYLVKSVAGEFEQILDEGNINRTIEDVVNLVNDSQTVSELKDRVKDLDEKSVYPSQRMVIGQMNHIIEDAAEIDKVKLTQKIYEIFKEFKDKRDILEERLYDCRQYAQEIKKVKEDNAKRIKSLKKKLENIFPIEEEKDRKDNDHIVNSVIFCKSMPISSATFITDDNLRRKRDFADACDNATTEILNRLEIELLIRKVKPFVRTVKQFVN